MLQRRIGGREGRDRGQERDEERKEVRDVENSRESRTVDFIVSTDSLGIAIERNGTSISSDVAVSRLESRESLSVASHITSTGRMIDT